MPVIFIFIDGLGLGPEDESNPFFKNETPFLSRLLEGKALTATASDAEYPKASLLSLDASLGVEGLPQSATGQTSLFTGINAPKLLGRHLRAFPNRALRGALKEKGMFLQLAKMSLRGTFANAYRPDFFRDLCSGKRRNFSCSTLITYYAGLKFRNLDDLREGKAVYMDITHEFLRERGFKVPLISPQEAAKRLIDISRDFDLTLYEHFMTDVVGHSGDYDRAAGIVRQLDAFLGSVAEEMDQERDLVLITSDHGNLENLQVKGHTLNPVPALIMGKGRKKMVHFLQKKKDISGVLPALLEYFQDRGVGH